MAAAAAFPAAGGAATMGLLPMAMLLMLFSGTMNTLLMKFMTMQQVPTGPGELRSGFHHPYFQTFLMMTGEVFCLFAYFATRRREDRAGDAGAPKWIFVVACSLDWAATTLVHMAYVLIPASLVQMSRGAIVIFTCLFSFVFLGRRQHAYHVAGVLFVFVGITLVSLSALVDPLTAARASEQSMAKSMVGISLCIFAQVIHATHIVYEEAIMSKYALPPLRVVGMQGAFGVLLGILLLGGLNAFAIENTRHTVYQIQQSSALQMAVGTCVFTIAFYNYAGATITKQASAVARSTIDVSRTVFIWAAELALGWNSFNALQLLGFIVLATGTLLYNRLLVVPILEPGLEAAGILRCTAPAPEKKRREAPPAV